ncbi:DUF1566 [Desulfonema limicola]|uniref:DUF1566 n=1 Tax=Desulfonema limicola TaxID=45656 RepID=A0A975B768_9BACT|nr:DUF1566 domain-containing protein [Desulfonema limicola]QTA80019.1 DUF1566 [Desulfonema limicola]
MRYLSCILCLVFLCLFQNPAWSGEIQPPGPPDSGSGMYSLNQLYNYLLTGTHTTIPNSFQEPSNKPGSSTKTTSDIYNDIRNSFEQCNALSSQVSETTVFFSTDPENWGPRKGTMKTLAGKDYIPGVKEQTISAGCYESEGSIAGDSDLLPGNIKKDVELFGIIGTLISSVSVMATGQTETYDDNTPPRDDGAVKAGTPLAAEPRFTDNGDNTITDNLTGLTWMSNADCIGIKHPDFDTDGEADGLVTWQHALNFIEKINDGTYTECSSAYTDWRLPNVRELLTLVDYSYSNLSLPNTAGTSKWTEGDPFFGVKQIYYWSSTSSAGDTTQAWFVRFDTGYAYYGNKLQKAYVWPVRGGE